MSSQQWKQQSGASRSRNVKATSVLFERSNFWQRGPNLELYHDNDGSTTFVGVGTTTPNSRLSFGDTARQRRLAYSNDGNFAFCEKSDGSEATGIGFYERFDNFDETSTRLFTGLKFIVNRDNNNTMDTSGNNIKMLLRDDGKLLLGHNPDDTLALQPFNVAMLDVSGNIRTSDYLIIGKQTDVTGYKPSGGLRYNGTRMIYTDEEGYDRVIKVESDTNLTGDWSAGSDENGNPIVYLAQKVHAGILRNLFDRDCFEAEFSVEGRLIVGSQEYLKNPIFQTTSIYDTSGDGVFSCQHAMGVNTFECKAMLDLNRISEFDDDAEIWVSVPFMKIGKDDVEVSGNSIGIGSFVQVLTRGNFAMGENILVQGNDPVQQSFVFGKNNRILFGSNCYNFGVDNLIHNNQDVSQNSIANMVLGVNNRIFDASHVFLSGKDNMLGHISADPIFKCSYSSVFGEKNFVFSKYSFVNGYDNKVITGRQNVTFGSYNDISNCKTSMIFGSRNIIKDSSANTIIGTSITSNLNTTGSFLTGKDHVEQTGNYNSIHGINHSITNTNNTLSTGDSNTVSTTNNSTINGFSNNAIFTNSTTMTGSNNKTNIVASSIINGTNNEIDNSNYTSVNGLNNTISFSHKSFVTGSDHNEMSGQANAIFGKENNNVGSDNSIISGTLNNMNNINQTIINGKSNIGVNIEHSNINGLNNNISDVSGIIMGGELNTISNNVSNSVIWGTSNTITGNDEDSIKNNIFVGNNNSISQNTKQTLIIGDNNNSSFNNNNAIIGINNTAVRNEALLSSGKDNTIYETNNSTVLGELNDVSGNTTNSLIVGKQNIDLSGTINIITGLENTSTKASTA